MKEWNELSMREKHQLMRQYVANNMQEGVYKGGTIADLKNEYAKGGNIFSGEEEHPQQMVTVPATPLFLPPRNWSTWTPQGEAYYQEHYDPYLKQAYSIYDGRTNSYKQPPLPEVVVTASNPAYSNNVEMQRRDGESENDYIERMSQLSKDRYDFAQGVRDAQRQYAGITGAALEQLQDSLIARKYPEAQRAAILATSYNEMDSRGGASRGVGGNGMMGLSKDRMPITLLGDTPEMRGKQIHHILEDLGTVHTGTHPQAGNWSGGGTGGPKIMSGQDGYNQFNSTTDAYNAAMILNKRYVRPRDRVPAWQNRGNDAVLMQKYMHDDGGILETIRQRLYTNIDPTMDYAYSIPAALKAVRGIDTHGIYPSETDMSNITGNPQINQELWARYLQQPMTPITTRNSQYKPVGTEQTQIAINPNATDTQNFINEAAALPKFNRYYGSTVLGGYGMNNHAIAKAVDDYRGQYVAYRDTYDLNPFHGDRSIVNIPGLSGLGDLSFGVGKPVPMYDRIYLDDYYGVNSMPQKDEYYGGYIPEVTVTPKKSTGGKLRTVRRLSTQF